MPIAMGLLSILVLVFLATLFEPKPHYTKGTEPVTCKT